jgi:serine/threonine-protein kinase
MAPNPTSHAHPPAEPRTAASVGSALAGRYRLDAVLGAGATATVFRGRDLATDELVAVKVLREGADDRRVTRLAYEAVTMRFLGHPNVPRIRDMGIDPETGASYVVEDLAPGGTAFDAVRGRGALPVETVARWMVEILSVLAVAHAHGIVHRDVKPSNVLIRADGGALLTDFGIVRLPDADLRVERGFVGTPNFVAPEQRLRSDDATPRSDLYSVGATMYALLTAHPPSGIADAGLDERPWRAVPEPLRAVAFRATRRDPAERWPDARTMAEAIAPYLVQAAWAAEPHLAAWLRRG